MIIIGTFLFVNLSMWASLAFAYSLNCIQNEPYLLGIQIPKEHKNSVQVQEILAQYKVKYRKITWVGLLTAVLMLVANEFMSILILAMSTWFAILMWLYQSNVMEKSRSLYELKKNGWLIGESHVVRLDTALNSVSTKKTVRFAWWIPSSVAAIFVGFLAWKNMQHDSLVAIISYGSVFILMFLVYLGIRYAKPYVYCEDTGVNSKIRGMVKFEWTKCFVLQGYLLAIMAVYCAFSDILVKQGTDQRINVMAVIMVSAILAFGTLLLMLFAYYNVKKVKRTLFACLTDEGEEMYGDDDEYWLNGYVEKGIIFMVVLFMQGLCKLAQ